MARNTDATPNRQQQFNCPACGHPIPGDQHKECEEIVCQVCLYDLRWKSEGSRGRWVLAVLDG